VKFLTSSFPDLLGQFSTEKPFNKSFHPIKIYLRRVKFFPNSPIPEAIPLTGGAELYF
jgi:hypothetical protein